MSVSMSLSAADGLEIARRQATTKAQMLGGGPFDAIMVENTLGVTSTGKVASDCGYRVAWLLDAMLHLQTESGPIIKFDHIQDVPLVVSRSLTMPCWPAAEEGPEITDDDDAEITPLKIEPKQVLMGR